MSQGDNQISMGVKDENGGNDLNSTGSSEGDTRSFKNIPNGHGKQHKKKPTRSKKLIMKVDHVAAPSTMRCDIYNFIKLFKEKNAQIISDDNHHEVDDYGFFNNITKEEHANVSYIFAVSQTPDIKDAYKIKGKLRVSWTLANVFLQINKKKRTMSQNIPFYVFAIEYEKVIPDIKWKKIEVTYRNNFKKYNQNGSSSPKSHQMLAEVDEENESEEEETDDLPKEGDIFIRAVPYCTCARVDPSSVTCVGVIGKDEKVLVGKNQFHIHKFICDNNPGAKIVQRKNGVFFEQNIDRNPSDNFKKENSLYH